MKVCVHIYKPAKITLEQMGAVLCYLSDEGMIKLSEDGIEEEHTSEKAATASREN
jgi:hypothetical protein